jgi:hypothetical protein
MVDKREANDAAPHQPQNRLTSESKLRRGKHHCPVCLSPLAKNATRTRLMRACTVCRARPSAVKRCSRCRVSGSVWENKRGAACQACGLHGSKATVILNADADRQLAMAGKVDHAVFVAMLAERFPTIAADIDNCSRGLLHMEMGALARAAQAAISDEDSVEVRKHFEFVDEVYSRGTADMINAVHVSYLENLSFDGKHGRRIKAREMLTSALQAALRGLEAYNAELFGRNRRG